MRLGTLAFVVGLSLSICNAALAQQSCQIVRAAGIEMSADENGGVIVPMTIAGKNINLLVDTGGVLSMLGQKTVSSLALSTRQMSGSLRMIGGQRLTDLATAHNIDLGGRKAAEMEFVVMPDNRLPQEVDGTLAPDVLSAYDDDFDFANNKFYLVSQDHCPGRVVYWTKDAYAEIPMRIDNIGHIDLPVSVDGKPMQATLDTGSSRSLMSLEAAEDLFGFNEKDSSLKPLSSSNEHWHPYRYPFKSLAFEGVIVNNPDLVLISNDESKMMGSGSPKIILGMGVLRQLHLYIAYHEHKLYVTPATAH